MSCLAGQRCRDGACVRVSCSRESSTCYPTERCVDAACAFDVCLGARCPQGTVCRAEERALNAERLEHWGARHPEIWARWYQLASTGLEDPRLVEIQLTLMKDPEAMRVEREAWSEAAQRLEEALSVSSRSP